MYEGGWQAESMNLRAGLGEKTGQWQPGDCVCFLQRELAELQTFAGSSGKRMLRFLAYA